MAHVAYMDIIKFQIRNNLTQPKQNKNMKSKYNERVSDGKPFNARQMAILDADPRVKEYNIEYHETLRGDVGRLINVELIEGFNYEGRQSFIQYTWRDVAHSLKHIKVGDAHDL